MESIPKSSVTLPLVPESAESIPEWFAELAVIVETVRTRGALAALEEDVHLVRKRMGPFETLDVLAMLIGSAVSGMPTVQRFCERTAPFGEVFMGRFGREKLPSPAALSRFLAAMTSECGEGLRRQFERFSFCWTAQTLGGLTDRRGERLVVCDVDGTRAVARHRRLPEGDALPCAVGSPGRKRGEVVRSRMTALHIHTHHWLLSGGGAGHGTPEEEVTSALETITRSHQGFGLPESIALVRLDGHFGAPVFLRILMQANRFFVTRRIGSHLLQLPIVPTTCAMRSPKSSRPFSGMHARSTGMGEVRTKRSGRMTRKKRKRSGEMRGHHAKKTAQAARRSRLLRVKELTRCWQGRVRWWSGRERVPGGLESRPA